MGACQETGQGGVRGDLVHRNGAAMHYMGQKNPWEVLFGCPLSLKHHMNVRWNSTGQTADVAHAAPAGYVSTSVQPQASSAGGFLCVQGLLGLQRCSLTTPEVAWHEPSGVQHDASHYFGSMIH